jgi:hypothetical protein
MTGNAAQQRPAQPRRGKRAVYGGVPGVLGIPGPLGKQPGGVVRQRVATHGRAVYGGKRGTFNQSGPNGNRPGGLVKTRSGARGRWGGVRGVLNGVSVLLPVIFVGGSRDGTAAGIPPVAGVAPGQMLITDPVPISVRRHVDVRRIPGTRNEVYTLTASPTADNPGAPYTYTYTGERPSF